MLLRFKNQLDVGLVEHARLPEVSLAHGQPNLLAFARSTDHGSRLANELRYLGLGVVGKRGEGGTGTTSGADG